MSSIVGAIPVGVMVSTDKTNWYRLSDHNRNPISINYELIENTQRMADGTLRKYDVARKFKITTDWHDFPTLDANLVDYYPNPKEVAMNLADSGHAHAGAWIKAFYEINAFTPIWIKLIFAQEDTQVAGVPINPGSIPANSTYADSMNTTGANSIYNAFMTTFTYDIVKRRINGFGNVGGITPKGYDLVNLKIEFTEI